MTIKINFYSFPELQILQPLIITNLNITAEEAIAMAVTKLEIKTNTMYLLSLYVEEENKWIFFKEKLSDIDKKNLYLRFRWLPPKGRKLQDDHHGSRYLYLQLYNDFRHNILKLQNYEGLAKTRKEMLFNTIVFHSIDYCIKWYNEKHENEIITHSNVSSRIKLEAFYPKRANVKFTEILRSALCLPGAYRRHMRRENTTYCSLIDLVTILLDFFYEHFDIGFEDEFPAKTKYGGNLSSITLVLSPYNPEPKFRGVHYIDPKQVSAKNPKGKIPLYKLHSIKSLDVVKENDVYRLNGKPNKNTDIYFQTEEEALQFIYAVHGYIRLTHNFYVDINQKSNLHTIFSVENVHIFGPIKDEEARERLSSFSKQSSDSYFLIKQRLTKPTCFTLFFKDDAIDSEIYRKPIERREDGKYLIEHSTKEFDDLSSLLNHYKNENIENNLPAQQNTNLKKSVPTDKKIYESLCLCRSDDVIDFETDINHISLNYQSQATIVNSEIKLYTLDTLRIGTFTNVCKASEENSDGEFFAVKQIRDQAKGNPKVSLALSKAAQKLAAWNHENICKMYGVQLFPFLVFLEYSELGSLCHYLAKPCGDVTYALLVRAAEHVARALNYLSNINDTMLRVHGNVRLRNVLIFEECSKFIFKLADSGCEEANLEKNKSNDPRIAPELLRCPPSHYSDLYAYASFIVELFNLGKSENLQHCENCPTFIYDNIVVQMRSFEPLERLSAEKAAIFFEEILNNTPEIKLNEVIARGSYLRERSNFNSVNADFLNSLRLETRELDEKGDLGNGHFGEVKKAVLRSNNKAVAVKSIRAARMNERGDERVIDFQKELLIMAELNHENIVKALGFLSDDTLGRENLKIVVEYQEKGSLEKYLREKPQKPNDQKYEWLRNVAEGMNYLSTLGIVHRDLAARNVLLNEKLVAKISDFGLARYLHGADCYSMRQVEVPIHYYAPEVLLLKKYSGKGDIWSYGVFSWEVMTDCSRSPKTHLTKINSALNKDVEVGRFLENNPDVYGEFGDYKFEEKFERLLSSCFKVAETDRLSYDKLIEIIGTG